MTQATSQLIRPSTRTIAVDGTYTILATRYGLNIGGTEGEYRLTLSATTAAAHRRGRGPDNSHPGRHHRCCD